MSVKHRTADEQRIELIRMFEVPDWENLFVLGCFARALTIYSQQTRALNLIDALVKEGRLTERSRVAVVGAGFGGLTAAAGAAVRGAGQVVVFEKSDVSMPIQRQCESRYVHPHIYDWPRTKFGQDHAGLPVLNWKAASAAEVVCQVEMAWDELRQLPHICSRLSEIRTKCGDISLQKVGAGYKIAGERELFDIVILAVGFGSDRREPDTPDYWIDQKKNFEEDSEKVWCFSGVGDGGLTDLMWRCIITFRHEELLRGIANRLDASDLELLVKMSDCRDSTMSYPGGRETVEEGFARIAEKIGPLHLALRGTKKVLLVGARKNLFSDGRSILNRLIVACLKANNAFEFVSGKLEAKDKVGSVLHLRIRCDDGSYREEICDHLIERYGPEPAMKSDFQEVYQACAELEREWKALPIAEDFSRHPLYRDQDFIGGVLPPSSFNQKSRIRANQDGRIACIVIKSSAIEPLGLLENRVALSLKKFERAAGQRFPGRKISPIPYCVSAAACFEDAELFEWTVRALCDCEFAVFDLTGIQPSSLTLLGIRSAARRGVTITVSQDSEAHSQLPFNIADLNPLSIKGDLPSLLSAAFDKGSAALHAQPESYLDLPAFDSLRRLCEGAGMIPADQEVLLLCWFDVDYQDRVIRLVKEVIPQIDGCLDTKVVTTLDSGSPQLVAQRLYSAIRRSQLCLIDWTGWRPNVFFELGVRLAVNEIDPIHIICPSVPQHWGDTGKEWPASPQDAEIFKAFFQPIQFDNNNTQQIEGRIGHFLTGAYTVPNGSVLSCGRTYRIVQECIRQRSGAGEPGMYFPDELLLKAAKALAGPAGQEGGTPPILYPDALTTKSRDIAFENLLAAWFYLIGRYPEVSSSAPICCPQLLEVRQKLFEIAQEIESRFESTRRSDLSLVVGQVLATRGRMQEGITL